MNKNNDEYDNEYENNNDNTDINVYVKEQFWFNDLSVLYNTNNLLKFFPSNSMTLSEILNSLVRLSFYVSIIFTLLSFRKTSSKLFLPCLEIN